jgi:nicotinamide-nucleotide amidase
MTELIEPDLIEQHLHEVQRLLRDRGETVAVAESITGGLLSAALTSTPGASLTFRGGLVVYATDLKATVAGVDAAVLAERGPVDPVVAAELAQGARDRLDANWGIGVTGVAGPDPQEGQQVGTVFIALIGPGREQPLRKLAQLNLAGNRNTIRVQTVNQAVALLLDAISDGVKRPDGPAG